MKRCLDCDNFTAHGSSTGPMPDRGTCSAQPVWQTISDGYNHFCGLYTPRVGLEPKVPK